MSSTSNAYAAGTAGVNDKGHSYAPGTNADGSAGANAGQALGDKVKGSWNVFHGTGEGIRGNVNSFLDNVGEQIAGRDPATTAQQPNAGGERPAAVAATGADEFKKGVEELKR
ncbi:hypothetical protein IAT38_001232 [Cryptococcus sp. DSM 104549]